MKLLRYTLCAFALYASSVWAESPRDILARYEIEIKKSGSPFDGFSTSRGRDLYLRSELTEKGSVSCSTCHTLDPRNRGMTRANKMIEPLAPVANPQRFTDFKQVEKWFARNCDDVLMRVCSPLEKGDFIIYLLSVK